MAHDTFTDKGRSGSGRLIQIGSRMMRGSAGATSSAFSQTSPPAQSPENSPPSSPRASSPAGLMASGAPAMATLRERLEVVRMDAGVPSHTSLEALAGLMMAEGVGVEQRERLPVGKKKLRKTTGVKSVVCFVGSEAVDWIAKEAGCSRERALRIADKMFELRYFHGAGGETSFADSAHAFYVFTAQQSESKYSEGEFSKRVYEGLIQLVAMYPSLVEVVGNQLDQAELTPFAKAVVSITRITKTTESVVHHLLLQEFESTKEQNNACLRGNSLVTKIEALHSRMVGRRYLRELLGDLLMKIINDKHLDLETNVDRIKNPERHTVEENMQRLITVAQGFVDRLTDPLFVAKMPQEIRAIAAFTSEYSERYLPEQKFALIGGFLLLRFVNPALIAPDSFELVPEGTHISQSARNNLVALSKLLQKLSNERLFAPGERDLSGLNEFLVHNRGKLRAWFSALVNDPQQQQSSPPCSPTEHSLSSSSSPPLSPPLTTWQRFRDQQPQFALRSYNLIDAKHLVFLHTTLFSNAKSIAAALQRLEAARPAPQRERVDLELFKVLAGLGPPRVTFSHGKLVELRPPASVTSRCERPLFSRPFWLPPSVAAPPLLERLGVVSWPYGDKLYLWGGSSASGYPLAAPPLEELSPCGGAGELCLVDGPACAYGGRSQASASLCGSSIYVFGGLDADNRPQNQLLEYSMPRRSWSLLCNGSKSQQRTPSSSSGYVGPAPRYGHSSVCIGGQLLIFGGHQFDADGRAAISNELWVYDVASSAWSNRTSDVTSSADVLVYPLPVTEHTAVVFDKRMWIYGGRSDQNDPCPLLWEYNPATNSWRSHPSASPRWLHTAVVAADHQMLVFGGTNGHDFFRDVLTFDMRTLSWRILPADAAASPPALTGHVAHVFYDKMYIIGGRAKHSSSPSPAPSRCIYRLQVADVKNLQLDSLGADLELLVNNPDCSDMQLSVGAERIYVHRAILLARAPKFVALFPSLRNCSVDALLGLLRYAYTGQLPAKADWSHQLAIARLAAQLAMPNLVAACERAICEQLNMSNVVQIFDAASPTELPFLNHVAREMIARRAAHLVHGDPLRAADPQSEIFKIVSSAILDQAQAEEMGV